jgi:hypothetical protein
MDEERQVDVAKAAASEESALKHQIKHVSRPLAYASGWMKFLAIISVLTAVYAVVAAWWTVFWMWLQVWLAFLLWKAADGAGRASDSGDAETLQDGLDRLRLYFKISGILALLGLISVIFGIFFPLPRLVGA